MVPTARLGPKKPPCGDTRILTASSATAHRQAEAGLGRLRPARRPGPAARPASRATFGAIFAVREFRALWLSVLLSSAGDRLALVALAVLVYQRTGSPLLAALAYSAGYLPWVIGGLFLADLADRRPRRTVMVGCDVARAVLV